MSPTGKKKRSQGRGRIEAKAGTSKMEMRGKKAKKVPAEKASLRKDKTTERHPNTQKTGLMARRYRQRLYKEHIGQSHCRGQALPCQGFFLIV